MAMCQGTILRSLDLEWCVRGSKNAVLGRAKGARRKSAGCLVAHRRRDWAGLRQRYDVPPETPSKLLRLIRKLDAIEGDYLMATPEDGRPQKRNAFGNGSLCT